MPQLKEDRKSLDPKYTSVTNKSLIRDYQRSLEEKAKQLGEVTRRSLELVEQTTKK